MTQNKRTKTTVVVYALLSCSLKLRYVKTVGKT